MKKICPKRVFPKISSHGRSGRKGKKNKENKRKEREKDKRKEK